MKDDLSIRARYLLEASRVRIIAAEIRDAGIRSELLVVARCYEELAEAIDDRIRPLRR